jgi:signal transduction histidine kinase
MREIIWYLNPETCTYQAFCDYLSFLVTDYLKGSEISVRLKLNDSNATIVIGSTMKRLWVNMVKSLLSNVVQYSKASAIEFELREINQQWIEMKLIDNGIGFDTSDAITRPDSTGLRSIQSRVTSLNGEFEIESHRGEGASVTIKMPIRDPDLT